MKHCTNSTDISHCTSNQGLFLLMLTQKLIHGFLLLICSVRYDSCLAQELHNRHPNGRILRRRVAWLVGQWVSKVSCVE